MSSSLCIHIIHTELWPRYCFCTKSEVGWRGHPDSAPHITRLEDQVRSIRRD